MKVPTYTSQAAMTPKTGQTLMSVKASPNNATLAIQAQSELFKTASAVSLDFLRSETKLQRATELAALENDFAVKVQDLNLKAMDTRNPKTMMVNWNEGIKRTINDISRGIGNETVKKRFLASAANTTNSGRLNIMKQARANRIDQSKATYIDRIQILKKQITHGNPLERIKATNELFGTPGDPSPDFGFAARPGVFEEMERLGLVSAAGRVALEAETRLGVDNNEVYQDLSAAAVSGNPDDAERIVQNLANPDRYTNITGSARNSLINKAIGLRDSLTTDQISAKKKALEVAKAQRIDTQRETNVDLLYRLGQELDNPNTFDGTKVTVQELDRELKLGNLKATDYNALKVVRLEDGPTVSDPDLLFKLHTDIFKANGSEDLQTILDDMPTYLRTNQLRASDAIAFISQIQDQKVKTPTGQLIKTERRNLMGILGVDINGVYESADTAIQIKQSINDALQTYDDLVLKHNVNPREAYEYLSENFKNQADFRADYEEAGFLSPGNFLYNQIKDLPDGPIDNDTYKGLIVSINESGMNPNMQMEEKKTLDLIKKYKQQYSTQGGGSSFGSSSDNAPPRSNFLMRGIRGIFNNNFNRFGGVSE